MNDETNEQAKAATEFKKLLRAAVDAAPCAGLNEDKVFDALSEELVNWRTRQLKVIGEFQ